MSAEEREQARIRARIRPSSAHRWMRCAAAPRREAEYELRASSQYAEEGTAAHQLLAQCLRNDVEAGYYLGDQIKTPEGSVWPVNHDMVHAVQQALDYIAEIRGPKRAGVLHAEREVYIEEINNSGTVDVCIHSPEERQIVVLDYKHGQGVKEYAPGNHQLRLYALGVLEWLELIGERYLDEVQLHIMQPRLGHFSSESLRLDELREYGRREVMDAHARVWEPEPDYNPGAWCRFCVHKPNCRAFYAHNVETVSGQFETLTPDVVRDVEDVTPEELGALMDRADTFRDWLSTLEAHVAEQLKLGVDVPGWKRVLGRQGNRAWTDEEEALAKMKQQRKLKVDDYAPRKLASPTQCEKLVGKKAFEAKFGALVKRSEGREQLAPASDPRPSLASVADQFDVLD